MRHVPLVGEVAAGTDVLAHQNVEEVMPVPADLTGDGDLFMLRVRGDSMVDAGILDGDMVAVHRTPNVRNRQIIVARLEDEVTVKRYRQEGPVVWLLPENEDFEPLRIDLREQSLTIEGLVVGERVTMGDLKGTIVAFLQELFGEKTRVVFRPSFFPYTEPSADVFASCHKCGGSGCAMCKRTGFIEVLGCGMVHPAVFEAVGYPKGRYTGFAFGMGIERLALLTYGVDDIRHFYENDLRFLEQFPS